MKANNDGYQSVAFAVGDELEKALKRIAELEARLAEKARAEKAEAEAARLLPVVNAADKYDRGGSYLALRTALNKWRKAEKAAVAAEKQHGGSHEKTK